MKYKNIKYIIILFSFYKYPKKKLTERRKNLCPSNYNKDFSNELTSKNLVTKKLIENILNKYIQKYEYYIQDLNDIYLISYYLFHCKYLQNFIKLNEIQIRDFIYLISSAKIISDLNESLIFKEGDLPKGFYIMFKGSIMAKISKFSLPDKLDSFFKREILQEYNLEKNNEGITWLDINKNKIQEDDKNNNESKSIFLSKCKISSFSPFSSIFQQRHEERLKLSKRLSAMSSNSDEFQDEKRKLSIVMNEQVDLFSYNIDKDNILCFGNVNFFNEYMREEKQIHLTSAYFYNKENDDILININESNNIILYIQEENMKDIQKKISLLNKDRNKFLLNTLTPLNKILSTYKHYFISTIKLIYISVENPKELSSKNNIFYLVYKGACYEKKKKEIIFDKGSFIGLSNLFLDKNAELNDKIVINSKGAELILFKINLNFLSENNQIKMLRFLAGIYAKQYLARKIYSNVVITYENKKIEQKEKDLDDKIKEYLIAHNIHNFHITDREYIDKKFQKNENSNIKSFNSVYINKKNIFQLLSKSEEKKKDFSKSESSKGKNKKYVLKSSNNSSNSSSPRTSRSTSTDLPFLSQSQKSLNNINQNPINSITYKKNFSTGKKSSKKIISRNESNNNINGFTSISSFNSLCSLSQYDKFLNKSNCQKKNFINKNLLLKNFNISKDKRKNKFHLLFGKK